MRIARKIPKSNIFNTVNNPPLKQFYLLSTKMKTIPFLAAGLGFGFLLSLTSPALAQLKESPIDIRSENTAFAHLPDLNFNYSNSTNLNVVNTGSPDVEKTIRANVGTGAGSLIFGGDIYNLLQFHFHDPSEHLLNGQRFPMEMHLVHQDSNGNLLVVGRWIKEGSFNALLDPIFSKLPQNTMTSTSVNNFNINGLLPSDFSSFEYPGSLTTSPYTEGVQWVVLTEPLEMSSAQIDAFRDLFPNDGNSRETQPLNGRIVLTNVVGFVAVPEPTFNLSLLALATLGAASKLKRRLSVERTTE
jgi:carbonic anhydrase